MLEEVEDDLFRHFKLATPQEFPDEIGVSLRIQTMLLLGHHLELLPQQLDVLGVGASSKIDKINHIIYGGSISCRQS
ncbi:unnamed protein product [Haemonchus placei]|uniref:NR LBD domain-containing protein n=1 Tax=Haemonchus placei TaxID=6290 RepID=A0A0N4WK01_HAEPC|nr:unnamed protein product [Haemonchus placei]